MVNAKSLLPENSRTVLVTSDNDCVPDKFPQFLGAFLATLSASSMGMCLSWSSSALPLLQNENSHLRITDSQGAWIGSLITLGACIGAIPAGSIANLIGRKLTLQLLAIPILLQWILIAYSKHIYGLYAARFLAGLACGAISVAAPIYVAELAHSSIRGALGTFFQVQITIGLFVEYVLGGFIDDFKLLALISAILPVIFLSTFSFMPETPLHLHNKGRMIEARKSLQFYRGDNYNIVSEFNPIVDNNEEEYGDYNKQIGTTIKKLIDNKATIMGLIICFGLMVFQQLSGINAVLFYASIIFSESGSQISPATCAILIGGVQVIATLLSTILIDRTGRKILLFISAFVMCLCLLTLGTYFHLKGTHNLLYLSSLPLICLAIFIVVFSIGLGPIPWMIMGEILLPQVKGIASSIAAAFNWALAFTVTNQFSNMVANWGIGITFIVFGVICGLGAIFIVGLMPETRGKDIDEVQEILIGIKRETRQGRFEITTTV